MVKCVRKRIKEAEMGINEPMRTKIPTDISRLQLAWSPAAFAKAAALEWENKGVTESFLCYMEQWLTTSTNW